MSLPKIIKNADVRETSQIIHYSKGLDESYPNMQFYQIWIILSKVKGI